ncbi:MAG TPA: hypothetical protein VH650_13145 [Gaiellaceae bacterium]|jgi:hypothetical protein
MPRLLACTLLVFLSLLVACSTGSPGADLEQLRTAAHSLVPASARVIETDEGSCVQFEGNPDCARLFLVSSLPQSGRADALQEKAASAGWEVVTRQPTRDGTLLELRSQNYHVYVAVWNDERSAPCRTGTPEQSCADELQIIEDRN